MGSPCSSCENAQHDAARLSHRSISSCRKSISMEPIGISTWDQFQQTYCGYPKSVSQSGRSLFVVKRSANDSVSFACRCLAKDQMPERDPRVLSRYMAKLSGLEHPHICKFVEAFENPKNVFLIYEQAQPVNLMQHIQKRKSFKEPDAADCIRQLAMACAVAHGQDIFHGRLTISDVVMSAQDNEQEGIQLKVCDMGLASVLQPGALSMAFPDGLPDAWDESSRSRQIRLVGSLPPEVACDEVQASASEDGAKLDIWAIGVIAYYILCGRLPFAPQQGDSPSRLLQDLQCGSVLFVDSDWAHYPSEARDCVEDLLRINPGLRPDATTVLRHPWLRLRVEHLPKKRMVRVLKNIRLNVAHGPLKRLVLRIVSQSHLSIEHQMEAEQVFRALDRNGDGVLSENEIEKAVEKYFQSVSPTGDGGVECEDLFGKLDRDGTGTVNLEEFIAAAVRQSNLTQQTMWSVFHALDHDGSGTITLQEIQDMVLHLDAGLVASSQTASLLDEVKELASEEAGSGAMIEPINFDEFVDLMTMEADHARGWWQSLKRGTRSKLRLGLGIDVYGTANCEVKEYDWDRQPCSAKSVYARKSAFGIRHKEINTKNGKNVLLVGAPEGGLPPPPRPATPEMDFETIFKEVTAAKAAAAAAAAIAEANGAGKRSPRKSRSPGNSPRKSESPRATSPRATSPRASRSPRTDGSPRKDTSPRTDKDNSPRKSEKKSRKGA